MSPNTLFYIIIGILIVNFIIDKWLSHLNSKHFDDPVPREINDVYDEAEYRRSQEYKKEKYRFGLISSSVSIVATLAFFFLDGFKYVDALARRFSDNDIIVGVVFFGIIVLAADILGTPFAYYNTFVIEEKYGFNKTTKKIFITDKIKGLILGGVIGGAILACLILFYNWTADDFWWYAWILITAFTIVMNMFYARIIVPMFNKQSPLTEGVLRDKREDSATGVGFNLSKIFVIDGSKRSTKANAYFSGFGREKRVTLYDTLINDLEEEEIVAVLAHEVGHYKKRHIIVNLIVSVLTTGFTLWLLSLLVGNPVLSEALGVTEPSFHIGLVAFAVLFTPISEFTGLIMNYVSRKFEYQADNYAKKTYAASPLISALKKLNKNSLSNLTPHPAFVFVHYSHPTLLQRFRNLSSR